MKRLGLILLFCIYAAASIGVSIKQFYCCNQLKSTTISYAAVEESSCGMSHKMKNCCKTKVKFVKSQDTHFAKTGLTSTPSIELHTNTNSFYSINQLVTYKDAIAVPQSNPPPLQTSIPLYQFYCNYRI
ncbi:HYC_CC_PP family protein [Sediminibacterium sp.]|uniref:HYC_CC_PP family protein n=1 Tax=Sediminibacterium sp. TaxID=1917865 RepID=UPI003F70B924